MKYSKLKNQVASPVAVVVAAVKTGITFVLKVLKI